jgi:hypothetical protein
MAGRAGREEWRAREVVHGAGDTEGTPTHIRHLPSGWWLSCRSWCCSHPHRCPRCALPPWVQAQTTYATLTEGHGGDVDTRVLKQKIWVEGVSYELQEIYGIEQVGSLSRSLALSFSSHTHSPAA